MLTDFQKQRAWKVVEALREGRAVFRDVTDEASVWLIDAGPSVPVAVIDWLVGQGVCEFSCDGLLDDAPQSIVPGSGPKEIKQAILDEYGANHVVCKAGTKLHAKAIAVGARIVKKGEYEGLKAATDLAQRMHRTATAPRMYA
ncbi:MAG: hypothetical protein AAFQ05_02870 [Pseudomonadota bacterium]